jgi:hypothetical protein
MHFSKRDYGFEPAAILISSAVDWITEVAEQGTISFWSTAAG